MLSILWAGICAVDGGTAVGRSIRLEAGHLCLADGTRIPAPRGVALVAIGKASVPMALAAAATVGDDLVRGLVVTKDGHAGPALASGSAGAARPRLTVVESAHPILDGRSVAAGRQVLDLVLGLQPDVPILLLVSGGASALVEVPAPGLDLAGLARASSLLMKAGADIVELNTVRRHLSLLKGGRLAGAARGQVVALYVSDVPGDDPAVIGSGLAAADPTTFDQALEIVRQYGLLGHMPEAVLAHLESGARGAIPETPKPGDPCVERVRHRVVARLDDALAAAAVRARELAFEVDVVERRLDGEARACVAPLIERFDRMASQGRRLVLAGGETVVTVTGPGKGGRNQEIAACASRALARRRGVCAALGTDGTDGPTDAAGGIVDGDSLDRALRRGVDPDRCLADNDAYRFLEAIDDLVVMGPTGTNVGDLVAVAGD